MTQQNDRQQLRRTILAQRDKLTRDAREAKSGKIIQSLWRLKAVEDAHCIFTYVNFRSDVKTTGFIQLCLADNKIVAVPYTHVRDKALWPFQINNPERDLRPGYCAIPEPDPDRAVRIEAGKIDIAVIPGSVMRTWRR